MNSKLIIQLAFLLLAAAAVNWYLESTEDKSGLAPTQHNDPDLYMTNASLTQYDATGKMRHRIRAAKFTHYPSPDSTALSMPNLSLYKEGAPPWNIKSNQGRITTIEASAESRLELWDSVLIERTTQEGRFINIRSENLTVLPEQAYAETDQTVIIDNNTGRTTASGMKAYLKPGRFLFYSNESQRVSTVILPNTGQI